MLIDLRLKSTYCPLKKACEFQRAIRIRFRGSTIGLAGCGIWLILRARFGMRVESRSGKRDFKHGRERDYVFLRGRDAGIVRYSMAG